MTRDLNYTSKEMAMLQHHFRITFYFFSFSCRYLVLLQKVSFISACDIQTNTNNHFSKIF